ncbi:MAG: hypothetical protein ACI9W2_005303 [Gammaproteobacteria bacterium]|jgi:hypothetical protein
MRLRMSLFTRHLDSVDETYFEHLTHAMSFALTLARATVACMIHALVPFAFERTGSECIKTLHDRMIVNRARLSEPKGEAASEGGRA